MFEVLTRIKDTTAYKIDKKTEHSKEDRRARLEAYTIGAYLDGFEVDKGHENGTEAHIIEENGFILIFNTRTKKLITVKSGRPAQLRRYYQQLNIRYTHEVAEAIKRARIRNEQTGANYF